MRAVPVTLRENAGPTSQLANKGRRARIIPYGRGWLNGFACNPRCDQRSFCLLVADEVQLSEGGC